jgi:hypothetical protein
MMASSTSNAMTRLLLFLIPVMTVAAIVQSHTTVCKVVDNPIAGRMPVCE